MSRRRHKHLCEYTCCEQCSKSVAAEDYFGAMERCLSGGNMRLIDADELLLKFNKVYDEADAKYHESDFDSFWGGGCSMIQEVIKETAEQPTAYDVNKVVKQLKERSKEFNSGLRLHGKPEDILTDEAVEIVKCGFESLPRKSEKDLISKEQLINKLNSTGTNITFDLPVEEILGENVDLDDFAALMQDAIQAYRKMVIDTIKNIPAEENEACKSEYKGLRGVSKTLGGLGDARFYEKE